MDNKTKWVDIGNRNKFGRNFWVDSAFAQGRFHGWDRQKSNPVNCCK
jgi:NAD-specific glutamate dehydrogenase